MVLKNIACYIRIHCPSLALLYGDVHSVFPACNSVLVALKYFQVLIACEPETYFRSSLLSLREKNGFSGRVKLEPKNRMLSHLQAKILTATE